MIKAELITIGDEILIGQIIDTNSAWLATQLNSIGVKIYQITSVSDNHDHILEALKEANKRVDVVIVTGGLGPTKDDITKPTICEYFNSRLVIHQPTLEFITDRLTKRGVRMNEKNREQALVPDNCEILANNHGSAPCMKFKKEGTLFFFMPGVPFEMKGIFTDHIPEVLKKEFTLKSIFHRTILTQGIAESILAEKISDWEDNLPENIKLAYLPRPGIVRLRLSITAENFSDAVKTVNTEVEKLYKIVPEYIFGEGEETLEEIIGMLLKEKNKTIATAESCTGGSLASRITSISGSSAYFRGSIVAYDNEIKKNVLKVENGILEKNGAVSEQVVEAMVKGAINLLEVDYAVATSGIAGPTGGTSEKPVGTVWIAVGNKNKIWSKKYYFGDNRERNVERSVISGLSMLRSFILESY